MRYTAAVVVLVGVVLVGVVAGIALGTWGGASDAPGVGEEEHRQLGHGAPHRLATARDRELAGDAQSAQNVLPREHRRAVTLASRKLVDGRTVELRVRRADGGYCLRIVGVGARTRGCGRAPSTHESLAGRSIIPDAVAQRNSGAPLEIYGSTAADVARVMVKYRLSGEPSRRHAELLRVTNKEKLRRAAISSRFGYFFAELPSRASRVKVTAHDACGRRLGAANFRRFGDLDRRVFIHGRHG